MWFWSDKPYDFSGKLHDSGNRLVFFQVVFGSWAFFNSAFLFIFHCVLRSKNALIWYGGRYCLLEENIVLDLSLTLRSVWSLTPNTVWSLFLYVHILLYPYKVDHPTAERRRCNLSKCTLPPFFDYWGEADFVIVMSLIVIGHHPLIVVRFSAGHHNKTFLTQFFWASTEVPMLLSNH